MGLALCLGLGGVIGVSGSVLGQACEIYIHIFEKSEEFFYVLKFETIS